MGGAGQELINREIAPFMEKGKAEVPLSCLTIAEDFGRAFVQSAVIAPLWNGLGQLATGGQLPHLSIVNEKNAENNMADSWAQKFGGAIGMAVDFHILGKLKVGPFRQLETANTLSLAQRCGQHFMRSAKQGAVYGAVFTESDPSNNLLYGRVANAGSQALTFGLLGGGSEALSGLKGLAGVKPGTLKNALSDMTIAGVAGVPAGAVGAVADASFNGRTLEAKDIENAAIDFGIIGFALAGINHGVAALRSRRDAQAGKQPKCVNDSPAAAERESARQRLVKCLSEGSIYDAKEIIERKLVTEEDLKAEEIREAARQRLVKCLSVGSLYDAERIIERKWVTEEDLKAEEIREAARQRLVGCLSIGSIDAAEIIIERKLVTEEEIREAARQGLVKCLSLGEIYDAERIIERKWVTEEDLKAEVIREAVRQGLVKCLSAGSLYAAEGIIEQKWVTEENLNAKEIQELARHRLVKCLSGGEIDAAERIIERKWVTEEDLKLEEIREAARQGLVQCLSYGEFDAAERIIERKWVTEEDLKVEEIREAARQRLVKCLSNNGSIDFAEKIIEYKLVTEEDLKSEEIREEARQRLVKCLSYGQIDFAERIIELKLVTEEEIRKFVRQGLVKYLSKGWIDFAERIIERKLVTEEDLKSEEIQEAERQRLVESLSKGWIDFAERRIERKWVEPSTIDETFRQLVEDGHVSSVVRTELCSGKDFNTIAKEYLGTSKLTDEEAGRLFEKTKKTDVAWAEDADVASFKEGAQIFGAARMLRYVFKANASPHEVLDGFGDVVKIFQSSRLSAEDFYNNVLTQVNRDSGVDDIGHSCARLKAIASDYHDNFNEVMEKAKHYPDIATIQDLAARFPDKASIFSSWTRLQQYSKLEHFIGRSELLPKIQELRLAGHLKRAKWLESLALHQDSKVAKGPIEDFLLKDPTDFLERGDIHSSELHEHLKPSNYVQIPHLDLKAEELREALIDGSLDRLQVFTPMKVEYEVGGVDVASELKRALGSREKSRRGEAQNPKKLFSEVSKLLKQDKLTLAEVLQGCEISQESTVKIIGLLYSKEIGLLRPPDSFKLVAEIHKKSDPLAVVAGDDTASCMEFGSGKNNVYMFNPNNALFTIRLERPDGTQRTIAQSVLTKDVDVRELVPTIAAKMKTGEPMLDIFPEEGLRNGKAVIAADNIEVHPNYSSENYKSALEGVYRDFFSRYVDLYGAKENLQSDKIVVGIGHSDALESLPKEANTYVPQAPIAYSDKIDEQVSRLSLIAPQTKAVKVSVPEQLVRTMTANSKPQAITELTFQDALPLSYLESKMYKDVPRLSQGLYDLENTLISKDINNVAKGRANLSFKYTDKAGKMKGYLLAYEGKVEMDGAEKPAIYIEDFASDSYLGLANSGEPGDVGGKLLLKLIKVYKQNYLDKGNMMPLYMNARGETSYALLMKHMQSWGKTFGYRFEMKEVDTREIDSTMMHDVLIIPKRVDSTVPLGAR